MENLTATDYIWFLMLGICIGAFFELIFEDNGIGMTAHLIIGILSTIFGGIVFIIMDLAAHLVFAVVCSTLILFLLNIYHIAIYQEKHPTKDQTKPIH